MAYYARFKNQGMNYRVLLPIWAIGTISEREFDKYKHLYKVQANQYVKTLVVNSHEAYQLIRQEYKGVQL